MSGTNTAVFGLYPDESELMEAIEQLKAAGFRLSDLSIMPPENLGTKDIGHEKYTKAPEGAVTGGIVGAVLGGALGWLTSVGMIEPPIAGAGTLIVAILTGIGALGTLGATIGALLGACRPEYEAKRYDGRRRSDGILLSVHCDNAHWRLRAKNVLRNTGARSIGSADESKADFSRSQKPMPRAQAKGILRRKTYLTTAQQPSFSGEQQPDAPALVALREAERPPAD